MLACAVLLPATVAASAASAALTPDSDFADLNGANAHILFGSPLPAVEIQPTSNASLAATLSLAYLLELAPNASSPSHPTVVAGAAPETLQHFNGTISPPDTAVNLIASLPVFRMNAPLWADGISLPVPVATGEAAILDVNYSVVKGVDGSPGVEVAWSISGWPWTVPAGDLLALEFVVQVVSGTGFTTCTSTPSADAPDAHCTAEALAVGQRVWGSGLSALKGLGPEGSTAWVSWGTNVAGSAAAVAPVTAGAYLEQPSTSALVISAPVDDEGAVSGSTLFLLSPEVFPSTLGPLVGELPVYGGAAAVFGVAAGLGIFLARRRDQAIERELAA